MLWLNFGTMEVLFETKFIMYREVGSKIAIVVSRANSVISKILRFLSLVSRQYVRGKDDA